MLPCGVATRRNIQVSKLVTLGKDYTDISHHRVLTRAVNATRYSRTAFCIRFQVVLISVIEFVKLRLFQLKFFGITLNP
jgi:hypothetical protein